MIINLIVTVKPVGGKSQDHYLYSNCQTCVVVSFTIVISIVNAKLIW